MSPTYNPDAGRRQRGAMLLELITGQLIGLMVALAALGSLAFMQRSSEMQGEAFRLQQRIDVAMLAIGQQLRQAGAVELQATRSGTAVHFSSAFDGQAVRGEDGSRGTSDTLMTSYQDSGDARDCLGNRPDAAQVGVRVDSRFSVAAGTLRCLGAHRATGNQTIVDQVEDFQVDYGVRAESATGPQFQFLDASAVGSAWSAVRAVRVCLQIASERNLQIPAADAQRDCQGRALPTDGHLRRVTRMTFSLRNTPL